MRRVSVSFVLALVGLALVSIGSAGAVVTARPVPVVAPGQSLAVDVSGFASRTRVVVQLQGTAIGHVVTRSTAHGRVRLRYPAPSVRGRYHLLASGLPRTMSTPPRPSPTDAAGDAQVLTLTVPRVVQIPFRVGGAGVDAAGVHENPTPLTGGPGSATGGLAQTGTDLRTPLLLAGLLGLLGLAALVAGRRRADR